MKNDVVPEKFVRIIDTCGMFEYRILCDSGQRVIFGIITTFKKITQPQFFLENKYLYVVGNKDAYASLFPTTNMAFRDSGFRCCGPPAVLFGTVCDSGILPI